MKRHLEAQSKKATFECRLARERTSNDRDRNCILWRKNKPGLELVGATILYNARTARCHPFDTYMRGLHDDTGGGGHLLVVVVFVRFIGTACTRYTAW